MWCMRYEAKHCYFKKWAKVMGNFKNITKTLANHHQQYICYLLAENESNYFTQENSVGPS